MTADSQDHFSKVAGDYAAYRPRYPEKLYQWLASVSPGTRLAWDAGTGNGQAAVALAAFFQRVIATDFSADQIREAAADPRVEYQVASVEKSGLADESVELITIAQALHWFNPEAFFAEARRVLVPGGVIAAWTYGVVHGDDRPTDELLHQFYYDEMGPWWPENRKLVEAGYRTIRFPFTELSPPPFEMRVRWSLGELLGYIGTWSAVSRCREGSGTDPLASLATRLAAVWGDPQAQREIRWPLSMRAGRA